MDTVRILQIVPNMHSAGIENLLMNLYRNLDRDKMQFDFLVHYKQRFDFDDEIESLGGRIYRLSFREDKNLIRYIKELKKFFKEHGEYKVIHGHMPSLAIIYLGIARSQKVPVRIIHSHNAFRTSNLKGFVKHFLIKLSKYNATHLYACSMKAGEYQYGKSSFQVMHNAIDAKKFEFSPEKRARARQMLEVQDKLVIGHIGRFTKQKNHDFLLEIFKAVREKNNNAVLVLAGTGELEKQVKEKVNESGMENEVLMLGVRNDTELLYQGFDVFCLPSYHEGLPVVGIEAQAAGLFFLASDQITKEMKITKNVKFLPINDPKLWANEIVKRGSSYIRKSTYREIKKYGYDIKEQARLVLKDYMQLYEIQ